MRKKSKVKVNRVFPTIPTDNISFIGEKFAGVMHRMKKDLCESELDVVLISHKHKKFECTIEILSTINDPATIYHILHGGVESLINGAREENVNSN